MSETKTLGRHEFVLLFDVQDGNPNGDPDAGNLPRTDPETGHGLVTDVALKRKVRNHVIHTREGAAGYDIFVKERAVLNRAIEGAYADLGVDLTKPPQSKDDGPKRNKSGESQGSEVDRGRARMCAKYFDVRAFGAVMSTGADAGQVRGPVQLTFARSIDRVVTLEHAITRVAVATEKEAESQGGDNRTMGRKATIPYGLYRAHGFISPVYAKRTGFSADDLALLWEALEGLFEHDRSAARGLMSTRALVIFEHASPLGDANAASLFERLTVTRRPEVSVARAYADYDVKLDGAALPAGVVHRYAVKREKAAEHDPGVNVVLTRVR